MLGTTTGRHFRHRSGRTKGGLRENWSRSGLTTVFKREAIEEKGHTPLGGIEQTESLCETVGCCLERDFFTRCLGLGLPALASFNLLWGPCQMTLLLVYCSAPLLSCLISNLLNSRHRQLVRPHYLHALCFFSLNILACLNYGLLCQSLLFLLQTLFMFHYPPCIHFFFLYCFPLSCFLVKLLMSFLFIYKILTWFSHIRGACTYCWEVLMIDFA